MKIKGLTDEDFINYKKPCMFICTATCSFKCDIEARGSYCQNSSLAKKEAIDISTTLIIDRYRKNNITKAICFAGLEPLDQADEVLDFIQTLRIDYQCDDDVVIYTGYYPDEVSEAVNSLKKFKNIIIKYGRFIPDQSKHFDNTLGVWLSSPNQYAIKIS